MSIKETVITTFTEEFHTTPDYAARAPGRANLIGEHTDYSDGLVMPFALSLAIWMAASPREDDTIEIISLDF